EGGVLHFGVTLSAAAAQNITLAYDTFFGTASMAGNDYVGGPGTLTILAGQTTGTINVQTVQDSNVEPDETMSVHLMSASFGNISQGIGTGTIVNDDVANSNQLATDITKAEGEISAQVQQGSSYPKNVLGQGAFYLDDKPLVASIAADVSA